MFRDPWTVLHQPLDLIYRTYFRTKTELWKLDALEGKIINEEMSGDYRFVGVFLVDIGFCTKNEALWLAETFNEFRSPTMYIFNLLFESSNWLFAIFNWDNNSRILIISFLLIHSSSALTSNDFLLFSDPLCYICASVPLPVNFRSTSGLLLVNFRFTSGLDSITSSALTTHLFHRDEISFHS